MFFGRIAAQLLAFAAIAGVFGEIPIVSEWAFWFMVGAYLLWLGVNRMHTTRRIKWALMLTILLTLVAIVGVFVDIPIVSKYAFWVMAASYVIIIASTDVIRGSDWHQRHTRNQLTGSGQLKEDDTPTIDKPPKGDLWDDQDDEGIAADRASHRLVAD
jgi:hypothetical protein